MKCPICSIDLLIADRQGIEIDYCPQCRGIWLDRGELDKLIDRSASVQPGHYREEHAPERTRHVQPAYEKEEHHQGRHKRKRHSFLGELFDFD